MHTIFRATWRKLNRRKGCASRAKAVNEIIETYWNVNDPLLLRDSSVLVEIIETYWNVNKKCSVFNFLVN